MSGNKDTEQNNPVDTEDAGGNHREKSEQPNTDSHLILGDSEGGHRGQRNNDHHNRTDDSGLNGSLTDY
ncbi:hypothetical protein D3C73_1449360 [compost metagenome]